MNDDVIMTVDDVSPTGFRDLYEALKTGKAMTPSEQLALIQKKDITLKDISFKKRSELGLIP